MLLSLFIATAAHAAPDLTVSGGLRTTLSTFNQSAWENTGTGTGGQLGVQIGDRVGTEWFADYITSDLEGPARRVDDHIGWSLLFYPIATDGYQKPVLPYVLAGHCFDYTRISVVDGRKERAEDRWSSAIQFGAGTRFNLTERLDLSPTAQYMMHLGNDLHYEPHGHGKVGSSHHGSIEGHLLFNLSVNYRFMMPKSA